MAPVVSEAQRRAMAAAAHGHSTLGIPAKIGREFIEHAPSGAKLPERRKARIRAKKRPAR